jgi:NitT/TauT family transport system ATP-binding protein
MNASPLLELKDVSCTFDSGSEGHYTATQGVSLSVNPGEFVSIVGPTGCGKSTILNVAAGLLAPSSGEVLCFGQPLKGINKAAGYMFQAEALMPWRNVMDNVLAGLQFKGVEPKEAQETARDWLSRVGLLAFSDRYPHQLSGGMRKRVSLAQVLVLEPELILMDEPFSALDIQTRQLMENEVLDLCFASQGGKTRSVLFITHDLDEAIAMSDRIIVLSAGPASHPIGEFAIDLPRPRDVANIRDNPHFFQLHSSIWAVLRDEVLKSYAKQLA